MELRAKSHQKRRERPSPFERQEIANWSDNYGHQFVEPFCDVKCPLCHDVIKDAHVTSCCEGHFCDGCIRTVLKGEGTCPLCRESKFQVVPSKKYNLKVQTLKVYCKKKSEGCSWKGALSEVAAHLDPNSAQDDACRFVNVTCPNNCGQRYLTRDSLPFHLQVACSAAESTCPYCRERTTRGDLVAKHWVTCSAYPLPCPNACGANRVERSRLESHLQECPLQPVECQFSHAGCGRTRTSSREGPEKVLRRKDVEGHMRECAQEHLSLLSASVAERLDRHEEEMRAKDEEVEALRREVRELRALLVTSSFPRLPVEFAMEDHVGHFARYREWLSPCFSVHSSGREGGGGVYVLRLRVHRVACVESKTTANAQWVACAEPKASGGGSRRLALFAEVMEGKDDASLVWPRNAVLKIQVVTHSNTVSRSVPLSLAPKAVRPLLQFTPGVDARWSADEKNKSVKLKVRVLKVEFA